MKNSLNIVLWACALIAIVAVVLTKQDTLDENVNIAIQLPEDSPDLFLTNMDLTQIDGSGNPTMHTIADTLSVYSELGESRLTNPNVVLTQNGVLTWRVTSKYATLFDDDSITFQDDVLAVQLDASPAMTVSSEKMNVTNNGTSIDTDLPVTIIKGLQRVNAIGMIGDLNGPEPTVELLSEVRFQYDPS